jgi:hypothetical protein
MTRRATARADRLVDGPVAYEPPPDLPNGGGENSFLGRTRAEAHPAHGDLRLLRSRPPPRSRTLTTREEGGAFTS